jgi:hypothetical protein
MRVPCTMVALAGLALAGCTRTLPIYNVAAAPVVAAAGQPGSAEVRAAIVGALNDKGWIVEQDDPGRILAEINVRSHRADIAIDYSATQYSITYQDSADLLHDGSMIHRNYNKWIMLLEREINQRLSAA